MSAARVVELFETVMLNTRNALPLLAAFVTSAVSLVFARASGVVLPLHVEMV
jgi:hypothetical protein